MKTKKNKLPSPYISQNQKKNLLTLLKVFDRLSDYVLDQNYLSGLVNEQLHDECLFVCTLQNRKQLYACFDYLDK